jgi:hypothetical protein
MDHHFEQKDDRKTKQQPPLTTSDFTALSKFMLMNLFTLLYINWRKWMDVCIWFT